MSVGHNLASVLTCALRALHEAATVESLSETDWASATFSGTYHRLRAVLEGPGAVGAGADFLDVMNEIDFPLPGHFVAEIALVAEERRDRGAYACLELEALTIEDC